MIIISLLKIGDNVEFWINKKECTGCGACSNICPKFAITMVEDFTGFKYPFIDKSKCINCGLCKKTCPVLCKAIREKIENPKAYAGWSKDENIRYTSTSGGLFTEITSPIIKNGGYIIGASYNEDNLVIHKIAHTLDELDNLKQSKYLQSDMNDIFRQVKKLLNEGQTVAFCGAPCQIAGLYKMLNRNYDNLLTIEFICRGMNSPKAYKSWINEIENSEGKKITKVWFKYKINGWKSSPKCTRIDFEDGTNKVLIGKENLYMRGYLESNLYIRPSCGRCKFNGLPRQADITLADFWGIKQELDDDKGTSLILINTNQGNKYFESIKENIYCEQRDINEIYQGNLCFSKAVNINRKSKKFLKSLNSLNFSEQLKKYGKPSITSKIKRKIKKIIKK